MKQGFIKATYIDHSLLFWARVCNQRLDGHAQLAAQELAKKIADIVRPLFPVSWSELVQA